MTTTPSSSSSAATIDAVRAWAVLAAQAADDKFGADPVVLAVGDVSAVTEFFVITSGDNRRQVKAIVDEVEEQVSAAGGPKPLRVEGLDSLEWVLVDFGSFVVHVFSAEMRAFYQLERLWGDCPRVEWQTAPAVQS